MNGSSFGKLSGLRLRGIAPVALAHWFFESDRAGAYQRAAADQAWERTLAFSKRT